MFLYTLEELVPKHKEALTELISKAGSVKHLAGMIGVPHGTVTGWYDRGRISKAGAKIVEDHPTLGTYFTAIDLRPELKIVGDDGTSENK